MSTTHSMRQDSTTTTPTRQRNYLLSNTTPAAAPSPAHSISSTFSSFLRFTPAPTGPTSRISTPSSGQKVVTNIFQNLAPTLLASPSSASLASHPSSLRSHRLHPSAISSSNISLSDSPSNDESSSGDYSHLLGRASHMWSLVTDAGRRWKEMEVDRKKYARISAHRLVDGHLPPTITAAGFIEEQDAGSLVSVENVAAVIASMEARSTWDTLFETFDIIERVDSKTFLIKATMKKSGFLSSPKDFILVTRFTSTQTGWRLIATSIPLTEDSPPSMKPLPNHQRGHLDLLAWSVDPELSAGMDPFRDNDLTLSNRVRVTCVIQLGTGMSSQPKRNTFLKSLSNGADKSPSPPRSVQDRRTGHVGSFWSNSSSQGNLALGSTNAAILANIEENISASVHGLVSYFCEYGFPPFISARSDRVRIHSEDLDPTSSDVFEVRLTLDPDTSTKGEETPPSAWSSMSSMSKDGMRRRRRRRRQNGSRTESEDDESERPRSALSSVYANTVSPVAGEVMLEVRLDRNQWVCGGSLRIHYYFVRDAGADPAAGRIAIDDPNLLECYADGKGAWIVRCREGPSFSMMNDTIMLRIQRVATHLRGESVESSARSSVTDGRGGLAMARSGSASSISALYPGQYIVNASVKGRWVAGESTVAAAEKYQQTLRARSMDVASIVSEDDGISEIASDRGEVGGLKRSGSMRSVGSFRTLPRRQSNGSVRSMHVIGNAKVGTGRARVSMDDAHSRPLIGGVNGSRGFGDLASIASSNGTTAVSHAPSWGSLSFHQQAVTAASVVSASTAASASSETRSRRTSLRPASPIGPTPTQTHIPTIPMLPLHLHRHSEPVTRAYHLFNELIRDTEGLFKVVGAQGSVEVSHRPVSGHPVGAFRTVALVRISVGKGGISLGDAGGERTGKGTGVGMESCWDLVSVVASLSAREMWDSRVVSAEWRDQLSPVTNLAYLRLKSGHENPNVRMRDMCLAITTLTGESCFQVFETSIQHDPRLPEETREYIRGHCDVAGFHIEPILEESDDRHVSVRITSIVFCDPRDWMPPKVSAIVAPENIGKVVDHQHLVGAPPLIVLQEGNVVVKEMKYDHVRASFRLMYSVIPPRALDVVTSSSDDDLDRSEDDEGMFVYPPKAVTSLQTRPTRRKGNLSPSSASSAVRRTSWGGDLDHMEPVSPTETSPRMEIRVDLDRWSNGDVEMAVVLPSGKPHPSAVATCVRDVAYGKLSFILSIHHEFGRIGHGCGYEVEEVLVLIEKGTRKSGIVLNGEEIFAMQQRQIHQAPEVAPVTVLRNVRSPVSEDFMSSGLPGLRRDNRPVSRASQAISEKSSLADTTSDEEGPADLSPAKSSLRSSNQQKASEATPRPSGLANLSTPTPHKPVPVKAPVSKTSSIANSYATSTHSNADRTLPSPQQDPLTQVQAFEQIQTVAETALSRLNQLWNDAVLYGPPAPGTTALPFINSKLKDYAAPPAGSASVSTAAAVAGEAVSRASALFLPASSAPPSSAASDAPLPPKTVAPSGPTGGFGTPWSTLTTSKKNLSVSKKVMNFGNTPGSFPIFRGTMIMEGVSPEEVFAAIGAGEQCRACWDEAFEGSCVLEDFGNGTRIEYQCWKGGMFVSRRDMIVVVMDRQRPTRASTPGMIGSTYLSVTASIPESLLSPAAKERLDKYLRGETMSPETSGVRSSDSGPRAKGAAKARCIRAIMSISGWILEPVDPYGHERFPIPSTRATFFTQIDLGGGMPEFYYDSMVQHHPKVPWTLDAFLKSNSSIPILNWPVVPFVPSEEPVDPRFATPVIFKKPLLQHHFASEASLSGDAKKLDDIKSEQHVKVRTHYNPTSRVFMIRMSADFSIAPLRRSLSAVRIADPSMTPEVSNGDVVVDASQLRILEFTIDVAGYVGNRLGYDISASANVEGVGFRCEIKEIAPDRRGGSDRNLISTTPPTTMTSGLTSAMTMVFGSSGTTQSATSNSMDALTKTEVPRHHVYIYAYETAPNALEGNVDFHVSVSRTDALHRPVTLPGSIATYVEPTVKLNGKKVRILGWKISQRMSSPNRKTNQEKPKPATDKRKSAFALNIPINTNIGKQTGTSFERTTPSSIFAELASPTESTPSVAKGISNNNNNNAFAKQRLFSTSAPGSMPSPLMQATKRGADTLDLPASKSELQMERQQQKEADVVAKKSEWFTEGSTLSKDAPQSSKIIQELHIILLSMIAA
ncbi:hypothetical protein HDU97_002178 [Phlyctochytrium planicorne]|nr:hypothetical protein HDU97_002178 [Phlyctochytrium planicorne]